MTLLTRLQNFYQAEDFFVFWPLALSIFSSCLSIIFWGFYLNRLPHQLPLFYSLAWGENQLASTSQFLILPALSTSLTLINTIISTQLPDSQLLIKRMFSLSSLLIALFFFITALKIIYIFV